MIRNPLPPKEHSRSIGRMFDSIAPRYDMLNAIMSLGLFRLWHSRVTKELCAFRPRKVLDLATGTCDLAVGIARNVPSVRQIIGVDISAEMLQLGYKKVQKRGLLKMIDLVKGDATNLPFRENSFDALTCAFGVRNFPELPTCLKEMLRVLRPGGKLVVLELSEPHNKMLRPSYHLYTHVVVPLLGKYLGHNKEAYRYLHQSIEEMPQYEQLAKIIGLAGFEKIRFSPLSKGIVTLFIAEKKS